MKSDLDVLMEAKDLDALLITGSARHNPAMVYFTGSAHLSQAALIKRRGADPVLFHNSMERDEAAGTGLPTRSMAEYRPDELFKQFNGDPARATAALYQRMLADLGITQGRLSIYGRGESAFVYALYRALEVASPELTIVGELRDAALLRARVTKDEDEIRRIRRMGRITARVVAQVADFLSSHRARDGVLVQADGKPLTVGDVKRRITLWLAAESAEAPEGTIFATGRDAGVPHSAGSPGNPLRLGQTIVFDIFPCEAGGGYFYDFTRTWCLGYAPDEARALYEDVLAVYGQILSELRPHAPCQEYQRRACELFEARGHPTVNSDPRTEAGFVHGLGHGLGLEVHERPWFGRNATPEDRLEPGVVVTIEPGLYYPERGMGVRLEDTVWVQPDGEMEILAEYPLELVLPVRS